MQGITTTRGFLFPGLTLTSSSQYTVRPIEGQIRALGEIFPIDPYAALEYQRSLSRRLLPERAEGWFAIPKVDVGLILQKIKNIAPRVELPLLSSSGELDKEFQAVIDRQPGDIVIVPAQLGWNTERRLQKNEFPFNELVAGSVFLTHLGQWDNIVIPNFSRATYFII